MALDGMGAGSLDQKISAKGCDTRLDTAQITNFVIGTLGDWTLSLPDADYHGTYTNKKGTTFSLDPDDASRDALTGELAEAANELCGEVPGTLAITSMQLKKFTVKLAKDRSTLTLKLKVNAIATNGVRTVKPKLSAEGTIAFIPTGGGIGGKISGQVLAPDGQIAAAEPPGLLVALSDFLLPPTRAAVSGLLPVPKGTPVELVHLSTAGTVDGVLATAKVKKKGKYSFNLDRLGHYDAPDLAVRVTDRSVQMRAILNAHTVDITPVSEAVFQLAREAMLATPGALLENFTFAELDDLYASVDLLTTLEGLVAVPGVDATVAAIKDLVAEDLGIVTYLAASAEAGQTDTGPGDIGNLFPTEVGNVWEYVCRTSENNRTWTELNKFTGTIEINGTTAMVLKLSSTEEGDEGPVDEYVAEDSRGLYILGTNDYLDFLSKAAAPYREAAFPVKPGSVVEEIDLAGMEWGEDLDGDGLYEKFDVSMTIKTEGFEAVSVPAGEFPVTVKQVFSITMNITTSHEGIVVKTSNLLTKWWAKNTGYVKKQAEIKVSVSGKTKSSVRTDELSAYWVNGLGGGMFSNEFVWSTMSSQGVPESRREHTAVWTGSEMIVWGGNDANSIMKNSGGRYDPVTNSWTETNLADAPSPRSGHTALWTGGEMLVWGGFSGAFDFLTIGDGARYSPDLDSWSVITSDQAPSARTGHTAVWTGTEMIVWGGASCVGCSNYELGDGAIYDPATDVWTLITNTGAPDARVNHTAVWTGSRMIVWGGESDDGTLTLLNSGGIYDPVSDSWQQMSTISAPMPTRCHSAVWTGTKMIIFGGQTNTYLGCGISSNNSGTAYDPATDTWTEIADAPVSSSVSGPKAIWSGDRIITWFDNAGARYDPASDTWQGVSMDGAPSSRRFHTLVWTGAYMIVWGGQWAATLDDGSVYDPSIDETP
jgi:hypothetical protein